MRKETLTTRQKNFIRENRLTISGKQMAKRFGCDATIIHRWLRKNNLSPSKEITSGFRIKAMTGRTTFTKKEDAFIKANYLTMPVKRMGDKIGRSYTGIMGRLRQLGLIIPPEVRQKNLQEGRIQPGNVPFNKGRKMPRSVYKKVKATMFKKGNLPHNTKADFEITLRRDHNKAKYYYIRVSLGKWEPLHRHLWAKANGAIPPKMKLIFKDFNTLNCNLENIEPVTPAELMRRNSYHNYPKPIAQLVQLRGALNRQINKHLKAIS